MMRLAGVAVVILLAALVFQMAEAQAANIVGNSGIAVADDEGRTVRLAAPARRIVSLAPHVTENLYVAGAGAYIVGAVDYSDYPEAAKKIPRVGSYVRLDLEAIVALKPDLVIAWQSGNDASQINKLKTLGLPLFIDKPRHIDDVAGSIERFGELAGTSNVAALAARTFRARHAELRARHAGQPPVRTFYQVWNEPLTTINGEVLMSDVMRLCGAENVFARLTTPAPNVTVESVLSANPEAIVASGMTEARPKWLDMWMRWRDLTANVRDNLFFIPPDIINRHTTRILDGAQRLCEQMETVRGKRQKFNKTTGKT